MPGIVTVLQTHRPNVILLMSGTNSLDADGRENLVRTILETRRSKRSFTTASNRRKPCGTPA